MWLGLLHPLVIQLNFGIPMDFAFIPVLNSLSGHSEGTCFGVAHGSQPESMYNYLHSSKRSDG